MAQMVKGSVLYAIDPEDGTLMELSKLTSMDLGNPSATTTDVMTWGDNTSKPVKTGFELAEASASLYPDSDNPMHVRLYELSRKLDTDGPEIKFALGWSDGIEAPTVDTTTDTSGVFMLPTTRTFFTFSGWVSSFPLDFSGDVVKTDLKVQRTDMGQWVPKEVA